LGVPKHIADRLSGLPIAFGQSSSNQRAPAQVPDTAQFLTVADFRAALQSQPEPNAFSLRYAQAVIMSAAGLSARNSLRSINGRCARWLLVAHDRVDEDTFPLTQGVPKPNAWSSPNRRYLGGAGNARSRLLLQELLLGKTLRDRLSEIDADI
jgi:hypothetical protein